MIFYLLYTDTRIFYSLRYSRCLASHAVEFSH